MIFVLVNSGLRIGELCKLRRKDITFFTVEEEHTRTRWQIGELGCLIEVHKSTKTGERTVNALCGKWVKNVMDKSKYKKKSDFLFCYSDGTRFTTERFRRIFERMCDYAYLREDCDKDDWKELVPYSLRSLYATTRLQNGSPTYALCKNMGMSEKYLNKHYSKFLTSLATKDLIKMQKNLGITEKIFKGDEFSIPEAEIKPKKKTAKDKIMQFVSDF